MNTQNGKQGIATIQVDMFGKFLKLGSPSVLVPGDAEYINEIKKGKRTVGYLVAIKSGDSCSWAWRDWKNQSESPAFICRPLAGWPKIVVDITIEELKASPIVSEKMNDMI